MMPTWRGWRRATVAPFHPDPDPDPNPRDAYLGWLEARHLGASPSPNPNPNPDPNPNPIPSLILT